MNAVEFLKERDRLTECCSIDCLECRLEADNCLCGFDAERIVAIVEEWAKDCPKPTYLSKIQEVFPRINENQFCLKSFLLEGKLNCQDFKSCEDCWNQEYKGV